uniref:Putative secreted protein n=1 Tax=Anopheles darlingi TaxID=43151 RepID=A0A2M4D6N5_ANODA
MTRRVLWFITHLLIRIVDTDLGLYCTRGAHLTSRPLNSRQSEQQSGLMVARHAEQERPSYGWLLLRLSPRRDKRH